MNCLPLYVYLVPSLLLLSYDIYNQHPEVLMTASIYLFFSLVIYYSCKNKMMVIAWAIAIIPLVLRSFLLGMALISISMRKNNE
jgi:hypothetical protein